MEFKSLKNIESSFRQIRLFGIIVVSLCALIAIGSVIFSLNFAEKQREKIYVLDNGKSLMLALSQDIYLLPLFLGEIEREYHRADGYQGTERYHYDTEQPYLTEGGFYVFQ